MRLKKVQTLLLALIMTLTIAIPSSAAVLGDGIFDDRDKEKPERKWTIGDGIWGDPADQEEEPEVPAEPEAPKETDPNKLSFMDMIKFISSIMRVYSNVNLGAQEISTSKKMAVITSACATLDNGEQISVTPALLNGETEITLVALGGTSIKKGSYAGIKADILSGFEMDNEYLAAVVNLFKSGVVPQDKPIVLTGISLGGMVAQQLLANDYVMSNFNIINIVCFGSPIICPNDRVEGIKIVRLCDEGDLIPGLSLNAILDLNPQLVAELDAAEKVVKNGNYKTAIGSHALSYVDNDCWNGFDALGIYNGGNTIELLEAVKFYK